MIFSLVLSMILSKPEITLWSKLDDVVRLVDVIDAKGLVAQISADACAVLDRDGNVIRRIAIAKGVVPLYLKDKNVLVTSPLALISANGPSQAPFQSVKTFGNCFSQREHVFALGYGAVLLSMPPLALPNYDHLSAVGINAEGDRLALMTRPMSAPLISIYVRSGNDWQVDSKIRTPEIEQAGLVSVVPRFNDLRFISKFHFVFIGKSVGPQNVLELSKAESEMLDLTQFPLESLAGQRTNCYLFLTDIRDGWTRGVAKLTCGNTSERGGPRTGRLSVSADQSLIYLCVNGGILKLSTTELFRRSGMKRPLLDFEVNNKLVSCLD